MITLPILPGTRSSPMRTTPIVRPVLDGLKALTPGASERGACEVPALESGEQYRFHFDMTRCIGCRCCEVACNEQNNNPAHVTWRRVGEVETGSYPLTRRFHVSMACNHCLEPTCLEGCPTDAYSKLSSGIVKHDAESCIGCQYCTWTCPYGVPQFHAERHVVTKCHLCAERLAAGQLPACVQACPTSAIEVEKVNVEEWKRMLESSPSTWDAHASAPGLPDPRITMSTTRYTLPESPASLGFREDARELRPEAPHWPLVFLLLLSQAGVGAFGAALGFAILGSPGCFPVTAAASLLGQAALAASVFHLGRPAFAFRALRGWRHSWLSREALAFTLHAVASSIAMGAVAFEERPGEWSILPLSAAVVTGLIGITTSALIYLLPARPAWNTWRTPAQFFGTAVLAAFVVALFAHVTFGMFRGRAATLIGMGVTCSALFQAQALRSLVHLGLRSPIPALLGTARLLGERFLRLRRARTLALVLCAVLPWAILHSSAGAVALSLGVIGLVVFSEVAGRYLFFVTVVPLDMPGHFFTRKEEH